MGGMRLQSWAGGRQRFTPSRFPLTHVMTHCTPPLFPADTKHQRGRRCNDQSFFCFRDLLHL